MKVAVEIRLGSGATYRLAVAVNVGRSGVEGRVERELSRALKSHNMGR